MLTIRFFKNDLIFCHDFLSCVCAIDRTWDILTKEFVGVEIYTANPSFHHTISCSHARASDLFYNITQSLQTSGISDKLIVDIILTDEEDLLRIKSH